jgi:DNA-binding XRE family transcriptional regulator
MAGAGQALATFAADICHAHVAIGLLINVLGCLEATSFGFLGLPQLSPIVQQPPAALEQALQRLGRNIRTARLRRRWRLEDVAERMGVSRFTVADVERGKPGTSMAAYLGALWVLGLLDQLEAVADPDRDREGKALEAARRPGQAPRRHRFDDDF